MNQHQIQDFSSDRANSNFEMVYNIVMVFCDGLARFQVLQAKHDALITGYFGFNKTMELVSRYYWWPQLWKYMKEFVGSCAVCAQAKNPCHRPHELLQPLPIPSLHGLHHRFATF